MAVFEGNEGPDDHDNDHPYPSIEDEDAERGIVWSGIQKGGMDLHWLTSAHCKEME